MSIPASIAMIFAVASAQMPASFARLSRRAITAASFAPRRARSKAVATRSRRRGDDGAPCILARGDVQRGGGDLHGARVEVDAVEVVFEDPLRDLGARPREPAVPRLFFVEVREKAEGDHEKCPSRTRGRAP